VIDANAHIVHCICGWITAMHWTHPSRLRPRPRTQKVEKVAGCNCKHTRPLHRKHWYHDLLLTAPKYRLVYMPHKHRRRGGAGRLEAGGQAAGADPAPITFSGKQEIRAATRVNKTFYFYICMRFGMIVIKLPQKYTQPSILCVTSSP